MTTGSVALSIYLKAEQRFDNGTSTKVDEVLLALWDEVEEQKKTILAMELKISMLETRAEPIVYNIPEAANLFKRLSGATLVNKTENIA